MKKLSLLCLLVAVSMLAACNHKTGPSIAVVDPGKVFQECVPGKAGMEYLDSISKGMKADFEKLQEAAKDGKNKEATAKLQAAVMQFQQRMNAEQQQVIGGLNDAFRKVVEAYRKEKKFDVVLQAEQALAFDERADITADIIAAMNKETVEFTPLVAPEGKEVKSAPKADSPKQKKAE